MNSHSQCQCDPSPEPTQPVSRDDGTYIFYWTGSMTGSQSNVAVLEDFAREHYGAHVTVIFNSNGGGVDDCRESYNRMLMLREFFKLHFTFLVVTAQSCALWFFQCADVRIGLPHSALMYHGLRLTLNGANAEEMELARKSMERNQREFTNILCSRSGEPEKTCKKLLKIIADGKDHNFSPEQALDFGWIDKIYTPNFDAT